MIFISVLGGMLIVLGLILSIEQYLTSFIKVIIRQYLPLVEGTTGYAAYTTLASLTFSCYLFNVTNPDEVMRGEYPNLVEHGPYVYNENMQRYVQDVDEELDEITYITRTMYTFNRRKSVNVSSREKVTILNPAYVGTLLTLSSLPPNFMAKYGNHIPKLFLNSSSIFLKARATDILFNGVKVTCNAKKFPELSLICQTMEKRRPPVIRETDKEGVYLLSMFQKVNDTIRGPYTVNRGVKDMTLLGDTTSFMKERVLTVWNSESCNTVRGTDTLNWPPLIKPLPSVATFSPDYCRTLEADYDRDVIIHGIKGSKYSMQERVWFLNNTQCYCPLKDNKVECLQQGLLDGYECQKAPIIFSEPHFLHGDPTLLKYAHGLKPDEKLHSTYIVIEPNTGFPLSGRKNTQLNIKLSKYPVDLLSNVSEGIFPLVWCSSGGTPSLELAMFPYQMIRLLQLATFLQQLPIAVGIYMILVGLFLYNGTQHKVEPTQSVAESILISSNLDLYNGSRRPPQRPVHVLERFQRVNPTMEP